METTQSFEDEKRFFRKHIPDNTIDLCKHNLVHNLPPGFLSTIYGDIEDYNIDLTTTPFDIDSIFLIEEEFSTDLFHHQLPNNEHDEASYPLEELMSIFGREAFGLYLPFHYYDRCWGIYLFEELIKSRVTELHKIFSDKISREALKVLYRYAVYRHELFHYQVERFSTKIEIINKRKVYDPSRELFSQVRNTEDWLEEALAESSVLKSSLVSRRTGLKAKIINQIYLEDLRNIPPGYRDYHCNKYGGPKKAPQTFASQIIENKLKPEAIVTKMVSIKDEFISLDRRVPAYSVTGFNKVQRIKM